jgi:dUTP pyrophosphatase
MDRKQLEEYIEKLKNYEEILSSEDGVDQNFINELNNVFKQLSNDVTQSQYQAPPTNQFNPQQLIVKVKKLHKNAVIPSYSKVGDAGMDLTIAREIENTTFSVSYGFGIAMEIPYGYVGLVFPRSSVRNQDLLLSNCVGVIDSGYRGELQATFKKTQGLDSLKYNVGDRGAQIIILPYPQVFMVESDELSDTERGTGGFGSTGL